MAVAAELATVNRNGDDGASELEEVEEEAGRYHASL